MDGSAVKILLKIKESVATLVCCNDGSRFLWLENSFCSIDFARLVPGFL